jgi:hypothetical protein
MPVARTLVNGPVVGNKHERQTRSATYANSVL